MNTMVNKVRSMLRALHRDEGGADMVEYILVIAAIALPLLAVIIWFWKDISQWAGELWDKAKGREGMSPDEI